MRLEKQLQLSRKKFCNMQIKGISFDSRKAKKDEIFFAIRGSKTSGNKYIKDVIKKKVLAVVSDKKFKIKNSKTSFFKVKDPRLSLAEACSKFYKKKPKKIVAVTGTNGKSSVANFFVQLFSLNNVSAASIGTLGINYLKFKKKTDLTSIDPLTLNKTLDFLAKKKINNVILEASSHGLSQKRLDFINLKAGIFTNFSHDHLDYHKNMKNYFYSKLYLFKNLLKKGSTFIFDNDLKEKKIFKKITKSRKLKALTISTDTGSLKILKHVYKDNYQLLTISYNFKIHKIKIPLIGYFQIKNILMAILAAHSCGLSINKILKSIHKIKPVPGRLECISNLYNGAKVILDYAHTPDALENSLMAIKKQFNKDIVLVFGCGGERDKKKRPVMGKIAAKYCRKIFVTDDNPRHESPKKIRSSIIKTCRKNAIDVPQRKFAIKEAIFELKSNEILLVAGRGHETIQDYGKRKIKFSDKNIIKDVVKGNKKNIQKKSEINFLKESFNKEKINKFNYNGVSIDTRNIKKNNLFFAIKGKKNDGHKFVKLAIKKGAIKSVISKNIKNLPKNKLIKVKNTFKALNNLARATRNASRAKIIGITGSAGKTTLKNLVDFGLQRYGKTYSSPLSYNNKYGVPYSLANLKKDTNYGIFEVGMSKQGEINQLSKIIKPNLAVITNISEAHLENFKSVAGIAEAKSEIINNISNEGTIILNKDDKYFQFFSQKAKKFGIKKITFGVKNKADVFLRDIKKVKNFYKIAINIEKKIYYFYVNSNFNNFIKNFLMCISILFVLKKNLLKVRRHFLKFKIPLGRGDISIIKNSKIKFKFIDESYNSNPLSVHSAIKNLNSLNKKFGSKKILLLGDMLELGKNSKILHKEISKEINKSDIDKVYVYGKHILEAYDSIKNKKRGKIFSNLRNAHDVLFKILGNNDILMIKGSNATGLHLLAKKIKKDNY